MTKRMGGLGKLSDFGRSTPDPLTPTPPTSQSEAPETLQPKAEAVSPTTKSEEQKKRKKVEKPVTINIKIAREQQEWLADIARQVRDNNFDPVPANDRCYPQHLIQIAIDLLASAPVNWAEVRTPEELRKQLNL